MGREEFSRVRRHLGQVLRPSQLRAEGDALLGDVLDEGASALTTPDEGLRAWLSWSGAPEWT